MYKDFIKKCIYISHTLKKDLKNRSPLLKSITDATFSDDMLGIIGVIFQFFAQRTYKYPQILCFCLIANTPNFL